MNWGYKILFVYLAFVAGILFLVFKANNEHFDLVEKDYYEAELKYQERIDANMRTGALSEPLSVAVENNQLKIVFPKDFAGQTIQGEALLYYPADATKDIKQPFSADGGNYTMNLPANNKGLHTLKLSWTVNKKTYYHEEKLFL